MGNLTSIFDIADSRDFYNGDTFNHLEDVMNDPAATTELNNKISDYLEKLSGQMYGDPTGQGYNNYTIPDKFKNGSYTLDDLFTSASEEFGVPKDLLVATSQHECGQDYMPYNNYTWEREQNCGGMMGIIDINNIQPGFLPQGGTDGFDTLNPALTVYAYAASLKFNHDYFKDLDLGHGFDSWDVAVGINAVGIGNFSRTGFTKQANDAITNLNTVLPEYKALREAYAQGRLGVNDLTIEVANGGVVDWSDGREMIYNYQSGVGNQTNIAVEEKNLGSSNDEEKKSATTTLSTNIDGEDDEIEVLDQGAIASNESTNSGYIWSNGTTSTIGSNSSGILSNAVFSNVVSSNAVSSNNVFKGISSNAVSSNNVYRGVSSNTVSSNGVYKGVSSNTVSSNGVYKGVSSNTVSSNGVYKGVSSNTVSSNGVYKGVSSNTVSSNSVYGGISSNMVSSNGVYKGVSSNTVSSNSVYGGISSNVTNNNVALSNNDATNNNDGISLDPIIASNYNTVAPASLLGAGIGIGASVTAKSFIGVRTQELEYFVTDICNNAIKEAIDRIRNYMSVFNALENGWTGQALENFEENYIKAVIEVEHTLYKIYFNLVKEISDVANGMIEQDKKMVDIIY